MATDMAAMTKTFKEVSRRQRLAVTKYWYFSTRHMSPDYHHTIGSARRALSGRTDFHFVAVKGSFEHNYLRGHVCFSRNRSLFYVKLVLDAEWHPCHTIGIQNSLFKAMDQSTAYSSVTCVYGVPPRITAGRPVRQLELMSRPIPAPRISELLSPPTDPRRDARNDEDLPSLPPKGQPSKQATM